MRVRPIISLLSIAGAAWVSPVAAEMDYACAAGADYKWTEMSGERSIRAASCLAGAGLLQEAWAALPQGRADYLRGVLSLLLGEDSRAERLVLERAAFGDAASTVWVLVSADDDIIRRLPTEGVHDAALRFGALPPWVHRDYAVAMADALSLRGEEGLILQMADQLDARAADPALVPDEQMLILRNALFLRARVDEERGDTERAITGYDEIHDASPDINDAVAVSAGFRAVALKWRSGQIRTETAVSELEQLLARWPDGALAQQIGLALARAYRFDQRPVEAVRAALSVVRAPSNAFLALKARGEAEDTVRDVFSRSSTLSALAQIETWLLARDSVTLSADADFVVAERLSELALYELAADTLERAIEKHEGVSADLRTASLLARMNRREESWTAVNAAARQTVDEREALSVIAAAAPIEDLSRTSLNGMTNANLETIERRAATAEQWTLAEAAAAAAGRETPLRYAYLDRGIRNDVLSDETIDLALMVTPSPPPKKAEDYQAQLTDTDDILRLAREISRHPVIKANPTRVDQNKEVAP